MEKSNNSMESKLLIGAHTSAAGGVQNALYEGQRIGATTVQLFTSNQKRWDAKPVTEETIALWQKALEETGITSVMSHDSYLINLGSSNPEMLLKSRKAFELEIERCQALDIAYLNFHPGAALSDSPEACIERIVESLLGLEKLILKGKTKLLLEATAGQGSSVGWNFDQLGAIVRGVEKKIPIGVCIDTCHIFAAGYDIRTAGDWERVLSSFDDKVGKKYLNAFHLNDSAKALGSKVDRHRCLGQGEIGWEAFRFLVADERTKKLPMYLETPEGAEMWKKEIETLKKLSAEDLCVNV